MDMTKPKIGVERQIGVGTFHATARMKELVLQVLDSGRLTAGPMMDRLEREIARLHDSRFALMCNSGTSALQIALAALKETHGWNDGDEVLVPAVTFVATSNVVMYNGLKPVFVDVEPNYYMIDPTLIEARITERTRAIIPVHLAGQPCDMGPIMEIAKRHNLRVVEDSCETMFGSQVRDLNYVDNVIDALATIASEARFDGDVYNVASGTHVSISDLAASIAAAMRVEPRLESSSELAAGAVARWIPDISALEGLGYRSRVSLRDGLARTVAWFESERAGGSPPVAHN